MVASEATRAQDGGAVLVHTLAGMFVRGAGTRNRDATSEERISGNGRLDEHLRKGGAADIAVAEDEHS
jgi:hypothetical protein